MEINIAEVIKALEDTYELEFTHNRIFGQWEAWADKNTKVTVSTSTYATNDDREGKAFISVGWDNKKSYAGGGGPCDNIQEVIDYMARFCTKREYTQLSMF